jgi:hypothetical protein
LALSDPKQDIIQQISAAWETAQRQLADLREQVQRTTELANAKVSSNFLERERDKALRDFGEAVWAQVHKNKVALPAAFAGAVRAMQEMQKRIDAQNSEISDLLKEGNEAAARLNVRKGTNSKSGKTAVAAKGKKR